MSQHANGYAADMPDEKRVTVEEAAKLLGLTDNAVRKRLERGTLSGVKVEGIRYVLLKDDMPQHVNDMSEDMPTGMSLMEAHLDSIREQIDYLKQVIEKRDEEMRRKDHLLAAALERIPELPAPASQEPQEARQDVGDAPEGGEPETVSPGTEAGEGLETPLVHQERRSWWRRWFGG